MIVKTAKFICSSSKASQCPVTDLKEYALIGRSNVGKSSLINMICTNKSLAKVSATPGKTRLINHFVINDNWHLVDLPGYGYAKTSKTNRAAFAKIITDYIENSKSLYFLFVLIDIRHEPQKIDLEFFRYLAKKDVPFGIVFTKADKLSANKAQSNIAFYKRVLRREWDQLPTMFITSSEAKTGKEELLDFIEATIEEENEHILPLSEVENNETEPTESTPTDINTSENEDIEKNC